MLTATTNTSLYSDQPSLFACLSSWLTPQSAISLRQSPQLDNGSDVVLLMVRGLMSVVDFRQSRTRLTRVSPYGIL